MRQCPCLQNHAVLHLVCLLQAATQAQADANLEYPLVDMPVCGLAWRGRQRGRMRVWVWVWVCMCARVYIFMYYDPRGRHVGECLWAHMQRIACPWKGRRVQHACIQAGPPKHSPHASSTSHVLTGEKGRPCVRGALALTPSNPPTLYTRAKQRAVSQ